MPQKILIHGGGVMGSFLAIELASRGHNVTLWEERVLGAGASGAGTGLLMQRDAQHFHSLFREFYVRSVREHYPHWIERLNALGGEIQLKSEGFWLGYTQAEKEQSFLEQCAREGSTKFEKVKELPEGLKTILNPEISFYHFPEEQYLENPQLLEAIKKALSSLKVEVLEGVRAREMKANFADGGKTTWHGDVQVLCSGVWTGVLGQSLGFSIPLVPVKGQVAVLDRSLWGAGVVQVNDHFYGLPRKGKTLLGATSEARVWDEDFNEMGEAFLKGYAKEVFSCGEFQFAKTWAGLRPRTKDRKPYMGWLVEGQVALCCGHYKNGLSMAPLAAECMADLIENKKPLLDFSEFSPHRKKGVKPLDTPV